MKCEETKHIDLEGKLNLRSLILSAGERELSSSIETEPLLLGASQRQISFS